MENEHFSNHSAFCWVVLLVGGDCGVALKIDRPDQAWSIDITYIKMGRSHMYLTAIIDWYSSLNVGYELSDTLDTAPVLAAVTNAEQYGNPEIINSDQGSQFTSNDYIGIP